jgi:hypothetical protein
VAALRHSVTEMVGSSSPCAPLLPMSGMPHRHGSWPRWPTVSNMVMSNTLMQHNKTTPRTLLSGTSRTLGRTCIIPDPLNQTMTEPIAQAAMSLLNQEEGHARRSVTTSCPVNWNSSNVRNRRPRSCNCHDRFMTSKHRR